MKDFTEKKATVKNNHSQDTHSAAPDRRQIPNSGLLDLRGAAPAGGAASGGRPAELENAIRARMPRAPERRQAQLPDAEREADRLSGSVKDASPDGVKSAMGNKLGADLSEVRFHTDTASAARADAMGARAYTAGGDVYFGSGGFDPDVAAHELVHTAQQGAVASEGVSVSAPMGGTQMWPWDKKKKDESDQKAKEEADQKKKKQDSTTTVTSTAPTSTTPTNSAKKPGVLDRIKGAVSGFADTAKNKIGGLGESLMQKTAESDKTGSFMKWVEGKRSGKHDTGMGKVLNKTQGILPKVLGWADKRSGETVQPEQEEDLGLGALFDEEAQTKKTEQKSKLPQWMQRMGGGIQKGASWVGDKLGKAGGFVADKMAGGISSLKRKNARAVDDFNNYREDYDQMSKWDKFMWSVKNPIARLTADRRKKGTEERNVKNAVVESLADQYRLGLTGKARGSAFERSGVHDPKMKPEDEPLGLDKLFAEPEAQKKPEDDTISDVSTGLGLASTGTGLLGGNLEEHYQAMKELPLHTMVSTEPSIQPPSPPGNFAQTTSTNAGKGLMTKSEQGFGAVSSLLGGVQGITDTVKSGMNANKRRKMGDTTGTISGAFKTMGNIASTGKSFLKAAQFMAPGATEVLSNVTPGLDIATSGLDLLSEGTQAISSGIRTKKMSDRSKKYEERVKSGEKLSERDEKMRRIARQGKGAAKADTTEHTSAAIGSGLKVVGGGLTASGVGSGAGTALSLVGTGVSKVGSMVADSQRKDVRSQVAEEELELKKRMGRVRRDHPELSERDAKHVVLKGMGFSSGKRREAAEHFTIERTDFLSGQAMRGDDESTGMLSDMGVKKTDSGYNRELIGERLGMNGKGTLEEQKQATVESRQNPFAKKKKKP